MDDTPLPADVPAATSARSRGALGPRGDEERYRTLFRECPIPLWEEDVTELAAHLERLRASGVPDLRAHLAAHPEEVAACARLIRVVAVNSAALDLYEAPDLKSLVTGFESLFTAKSRAAFRELVVALSEGRRHLRIETENRTLRGRTLPISLHWSLLPDRDGRPTRVLISVLDLTERARREEALRRSEGRWRDLVETSAAWIWETDASLRHVYTNAFVTACLGYAPAEFLRKNTVELIHPDDRHLVGDLLRQALARSEGWSGVVLRWRHRDGSWRHIESSGSAFFDEAGAFAGLRGLDRDVSEHLKADEALRENEARLERSQALANIGSWTYDATTGEIWWSASLYRIFALRPEDGPVTKERFFGCIHPDDRARLRAEVESCRPERTDYRILLPDRSVRHIHEEVEIHRDAGGAAIRYSGTAQDVTARRAAEEQLRQSEERFKTLIESTSDWIWEVDEEARYTYASPKVRDLLGYEPREVIGKTPFDLMEPQEAERVARLVRETTQAGRPFAGLVNVNLHKDGRRVTLETSGVPIIDAGGRLRGYRGIDRDVTERHLLEQERLKTQKLESIGTLAGGIAHDFNNLLQGVFGYISTAKAGLDPAGQPHAILDQSEKALHLAVSLTSRLLTFARGGAPVKTRLALGPVLENAARFALSGSRSDFRLEVAPDLWTADADEGQIGQVIQNIVLNADQSMPSGGLVAIAARNLPAAQVAARSGLERRDYVEITVTDRGSGIPAADVERIFDPYFSTKDAGSGLGLATSYSIVRNHGGRIDVRSEPGSGSTFVVLLPAAGAPGPAAATEPVPAPAPARAARVLVMDDEDLVRRVARELLQSLGHTVELACHGEEALRKYGEAREAGRPFDAVILDLTIKGGLGGAETMRALAGVDPGVRAIVSSGYSEDGVVADFRKHGFRAFLKKPYNLEQLRRTLADALA